MLLTKVEVENFLSVNGACQLPLDPRITVLLGANDHGKSNLLRAIEHLNVDEPIRPEEKNWDAKEVSIRYHFILKKHEIDQLTKAAIRLDERIREEHDRVSEPSEDDYLSKEETSTTLDPISKTPPIAAQPLSSPAFAASENFVNYQKALLTVASRASTAQAIEEDVEFQDLAEMIEDARFLSETIASEKLILVRKGVGLPIEINGRSLEDMPEDFDKIFRSIIPRVELFQAFSGELQDSVTAAEITKADSEFLQGVFFYAGIDPFNCESLFEQDDETDKTLEEASKKLDNALRKIWAQGVDLDLHFQLKHRSGSIEFLANDPAVKRRHARMSKRSAGVTQFFRLSMVLHARRQKNPANSYIYLFDEPGVFLHPKGQKDLLAVFEQLAGETQILYATHSLFMLNQNYPERHRLITKSQKSTLVDSKPYRANWRYAVDALGVRLTANILFSPSILLVEGDSDPLYIYELFRVLNHLNLIDADANLLGIMSYGDLHNLRFLIQTFKTESKERSVCVLLEGDNRGRDYGKSIKSLCNALDVKTTSLETATAIEDYCLQPELLIEAVFETLKLSFDAVSKPVPPDLRETLKKSWGDFQNRTSKSSVKPKKSTETIPAQPEDGQAAAGDAGENKVDNAGSWFKEFSENLQHIGGSSKVALARNYVFLARDSQIDNSRLDSKRVQAATDLVRRIIEALNLPSVKAKQEIESVPTE